MLSSYLHIFLSFKSKGKKFYLLRSLQTYEGIKMYSACKPDHNFGNKLLGQFHKTPINLILN